jgi:hypothetical protein
MINSSRMKWATLVEGPAQALTGRKLWEKMARVEGRKEGRIKEKEEHKRETKYERDKGKQ